MAASPTSAASPAAITTPTFSPICRGSCHATVRSDNDNLSDWHPYSRSRISHAKNGVRFSQLERQHLRRMRHAGSELTTDEEVSAA